MPIRPIKADMSAKKCKNQRFPNIVVLYIDGKDILCLLRITMEAIVQKQVKIIYLNQRQSQADSFGGYWHCMK